MRFRLPLRPLAALMLSAGITRTAHTQTVPVAGLTGTLVVTNKTPATATIIDVGTGQTLATLPTGNGPHEIVLTRDGRTAVVSDYGTGPAPGSTLTIIDVPAKRVVRTISLGEYRRPHGLAFLPGDSLVAVTSEANRALLIVRLASGEIARAIPTDQAGSHMVGLSADGSRAWTGNIGSNTVSEIDLVNGRALRTIAVPAQPEAINVTPDGRQVWVGSNATGRVSVVDPSTATVSLAAEGFGWPYRVLFTPDTRAVLMPDLRKEELRIVDRATRAELARLPLAGKAPQGITITPDGRYAFLSFSAARAVAIIDVAAHRIVGEVAAGETPDGVVYTARVVRRDEEP
ncbi:MAG: YncE family protein [Gemmatimonadetes bacterium]|nr:YncE family protein [Gemmatimonadota bacterium]